MRIMNPLSQDLGVMRQTLLFGGLESIQRNANRKHSDLKFYEFGNCYHRRASGGEKPCGNEQDPLRAYSEEMHLGMWLTGNKAAQSWVRREEKTTFYELRAYVNNVLTRLGIAIDKLKIERLEGELYQDGLRLIAQNGKQIGFIGIVDCKVLKAFDIDQPVYYADLDWKQLLKQNKQYKVCDRRPAEVSGGEARLCIAGG